MEKPKMASFELGFPVSRG